MRLLRKLTNKEWKEIGEKYKDGGVHMYRGKKTFFYNGEKLYEASYPWPLGDTLVYDEDERRSWEVIIILPGVKVIPEWTFAGCWDVETVIMSDTVKRIKEGAFSGCFNLAYVRLSRHLEVIGEKAFFNCKSLTSVFIPPSCTEIHDDAFTNCKKLLILSVPQHTQLGWDVVQRTALISASPFEVDEDEEYENHADVNNWIKNINMNEEYELHAACASFNPLENIFVGILKRKGLRAFRKENSIGVTPMQYLLENPFVEIDQQKLINRYITDMMGESV